MTRKLGLQQTNFFWSSHDNNATRRSYLMNELKNNYANVDYREFKTEELRFKGMVERVHEASSGKRKIRVTG